MNHTYRLVWNRTARRYVPAAESAHAAGKAGGGHAGAGKAGAGKPLRCLAALLLATGAASVQALPNDGQVVAGQGSVATSGNTMTITQQSNSMSLNWLGFNIGGGETVRFVQPSASAIALNRVLGGDPSRIFGNLQANGQVFLINPNGVLFGPGAQVDVGGLVASTLNISDSDLQARRFRFTGSGGSVVNQGSLKAAPGGYVALLGGQVSNQGIISAQLGTVALAAGSAVTLDFSGNQLIRVQVDAAALGALAENHQLIRADGGSVIMTAAARDALLSTVVNNTGVIEARRVDNQGGVIRLLGGTGNGTEGGTVHVGGRLDTGAPAGDAGGNTAGNSGGMIETSGAKVEIAPGAVVNPGRGGTWLIDPTDITINAPAAAVIAATLNGGGNVIEDTSGGGADAGDITVASAISWTGTGTLTLNADRHIAINAAISGANGGLILSAGGDISASAPVSVGSFSLNAGNWRQLGSLPAFAATDFQLNGGSFLRAAGGAGSAADPYRLSDIYGLQGIGSSAALLGSSYALTGNIDASGTAQWNGGAGFKPIGDFSTTFTGNLDGGGNSIANLTINQPGSTPVGLFGYVGAGGAVRNITLAGGSISGFENVGALAGLNEGDLDNARSSAAVSSTMMSAGGLVGMNLGTVRNSASSGVVSGSYETGGLIGTNQGLVSDAHATGAVSGQTNTGGLIGNNSGNATRVWSSSPVNGEGNTGGLIGSNTGTVSLAYATGAVNATNSSTGGLAGYNNGAISDAYATGAVTARLPVFNGIGAEFTGGLIGTQDTGGSITRVYATGLVSGDSVSIGGLIGLNNISSISQAYWDRQTSGRTRAIGRNNFGGTTSLTTVQAKTQASYTGFDFTNTWMIYGGNSTPLLRAFMTPVTVSAANATRTYDGTAYSGGNGYSVPAGFDASLLLGTAAYGGTSQGARNAGNYGLSLGGLYSGQQGYLISYAPGTLTINPAALTYTATAASLTAGQAIAGLTGTLTGLVGGDTLAGNTTGTLSWTTPATAASPAGVYAINGGGLTLTTANYTLNQAAGNATALTLVAAPPPPPATGGSGGAGGSNGSAYTGVINYVNSLASGSGGNTSTPPIPVAANYAGSAPRFDAEGAARPGQCAMIEIGRSTNGETVTVENCGVRLPPELQPE